MLKIVMIRETQLINFVPHFGIKLEKKRVFESVNTGLS